MESKEKFKPDPDLRLMDQVRQVLRYHRYAYRTEQAYCDWIVRFIKLNGSRVHPKDMGKAEIDAFLSHLATRVVRGLCNHPEAGSERRFLPLEAHAGSAR